MVSMVAPLLFSTATTRLLPSHKYGWSRGIDTHPSDRETAPVKTCCISSVGIKPSPELIPVRVVLPNQIVTGLLLLLLPLYWNERVEMKLLTDRPEAVISSEV